MAKTKKAPRGHDELVGHRVQVNFSVPLMSPKGQKCLAASGVFAGEVLPDFIGLKNIDNVLGEGGVLGPDAGVNGLSLIWPRTQIASIWLLD